MSEVARPSAPSIPPSRSTADRVAVVVNGNAKQVTAELVEMLDQIVRSGDLFVSRSLEEGHEIAQTIVDRGYPTVLTGGGDGTFTQMVTWVTGYADRTGKPRPRFGLLKLGTGNALAWVVGAQHLRGTGVVADLARLRNESGSRKMRLIEVEGMLTPFAGFGIDANALDDYNKTKEALRRVPLLRRFAGGGAAYAISIATRSLPGYLFKGHPHVRIVNDGEPAIRMGTDGRPIGAPIPRGETLYDGPCRIVGMSTIPYWGFGARIFPFADEREDRFSVRVADLTSFDVALHLREIWTGTYKSDTLHDFLAESITVRFDEPVAFQIGGDPYGPRTTVHAALATLPIELVDYYSPPRGNAPAP